MQYGRTSFSEKSFSESKDDSLSPLFASKETVVSKKAFAIEPAAVSTYTPAYLADFNPTEATNKKLDSQTRRLVYSGLWTFASINYLYCDLAGFMDKDMHEEYHNGEVNGVEMTPGLIAASAAMMQVAIANVFLPHVIKNDKTLRWVQIASGAFMTLVQTATLFVGEPSSYYMVFSGVEIAATTFITLNALKWKI